MDENPIERLNLHLASLSNSVNVHTALNRIEVFDGDEKHFRNWIKSLEKYAILSKIPQIEIKQLAFSTSTGYVSDSIQRRLKKFPDETWDSLKGELNARFGMVSDAHFAGTMLRKLRQKYDENIQVFSERLLSLAEETYGDLPGGIEAHERELLGIFIDGIRSNSIRLKLMRENPDCFATAVKSATKEQNLRLRFSLRSTHDRPQRRFPYFREPNLRQNGRVPFQYSKHVFDKSMEVDNIRQNLKFKANCYRRNVNKSMSKHFNTARRFQSRTVLCHHCNKPGHIRPQCPQLKHPLN